MIEAQTTNAVASLSAMLVRRNRPLLRLAPPARIGLAVAMREAPRSGLAEDLRFFLTCYAAGFVFFLIMLS